MSKKQNDIIKLVKASACAHLNGHLLDKPLENRNKRIGKSNKRVEKPSKEKTWIATQLWAWSKEKGIDLTDEHVFAKGRKFRFDWAFLDLKIAIEYEGLFSEKSGHTTVTGYTENTDKYNLAQLLGWVVIRVTALNYKKLIRLLDEQYLITAERQKK